MRMSAIRHDPEGPLARRRRDAARAGAAGPRRSAAGSGCGTRGRLVAGLQAGRSTRKGHPPPSRAPESSRHRRPGRPSSWPVRMSRGNRPRDTGSREEARDGRRTSHGRGPSRRPHRLARRAARGVRAARAPRDVDRRGDGPRRAHRSSTVREGRRRRGSRRATRRCSSWTPRTTWTSPRRAGSWAPPTSGSSRRPSSPPSPRTAIRAPSRPSPSCSASRCTSTSPCATAPEIVFHAGSHRFTVHVDRQSWERASGVAWADLAQDDGQPAWAR